MNNLRKPNPAQADKIKRLEVENQNLKSELATMNTKIEEYIREVTMQLSSAEQWLNEHVDEQPWLSEDD